jgi:hypothetical protein
MGITTIDRHPILNHDPDQWHKIVMILLHKFEKKEIVITAQDVMRLAHSPYKHILVDDKLDGIHFILADPEEVKARKIQP